MTQEEKGVLTTLSVVLLLGGLAGVGYYLIKKELPTSSGPVPTKVSSKCDTNDWSSGAELTIQWSTYAGAASYNVLHLTSSAPIAHVTTTQAKITGLALGYLTLAIQVLDASGNVLATGPYVKFTVCSMPGDPCYPEFKC